MWTDLGDSNTDYAVEEFLLGALALVLIENNGPDGQLFSAIDRDLNIEDFKKD
ncbi:hypothetical protein [Psychroflexus sp. MES1-P1E]|uniref:hypothetical protein n=1 Tax=Psychroflexus sp. MES1-P1E TaxID=2058320 RepID=UPI0015E095B9|nr:hypothetical protein [Psychroflexus sp. MES1-P1E]